MAYDKGGGRTQYGDEEVEDGLVGDPSPTNVEDEDDEESESEVEPEEKDWS